MNPNVARVGSARSGTPYSAKRAYETGFRATNIQPGETKRDVGQFQIDADDEAAPPLAISVGVRLGNSPGNTNVQTFVDATEVSWQAAFLRVEWGSGVGGNDLQQMDLDLVDGCGFSLLGRDARFYVIYPISTPNNLVQPAIDVSVSVGVGSSGPSIAGCRRTVPIGTLNNATSGNFAIPSYAALATLQTSDATATATLTQIRSSQGGATIAVSTIQKQFGQAVPIAHGARGFNVNGTAADVAVIFYLTPA